MNPLAFVPRRLDSLLRERTSFSRKQVITFIREKRVRYRGNILDDPKQLIIDDSEVEFCDQPLPPCPPRKIFALNKPEGLITAHSSGIGKATIGPLLGKMGKGITHIGRLDRMTTGLLLATNDGDLCHALSDPACRIEKKYHLLIKGSYKAGDENIIKMGRPIHNHKTQPPVVYQAERVLIVGKSLTTTTLEVVLCEGKNRQIRRMCAICHLELLHLSRVSVGPILIANLGTGEFRELNWAEEEELLMPFGGVNGFEKQRITKLLAQLESGAFLPEVETGVRKWKEEYLS